MLEQQLQCRAAQLWPPVHSMLGCSCSIRACEHRTSGCLLSTSLVQHQTQPTVREGSVQQNPQTCTSPAPGWIQACPRAVGTHQPQPALTAGCLQQSLRPVCACSWKMGTCRKAPLSGGAAPGLLAAEAQPCAWLPAKQTPVRMIQTCSDLLQAGSDRCAQLDATSGCRSVLRSGSKSKGDCSSQPNFGIGCALHVTEIAPQIPSLLAAHPKCHAKCCTCCQ